MKRIFIILVAVFALLLLMALMGPSLPEGNPMRELGESIREFGGMMGRGFGGGYQPITPSG